MTIVRVVAVLLLLSIVSGLSDREYKEAFTDWMQQYQKSYNHDEFHTRYSTWKANYNMIEHHNTMADEKGYSLGMNQFGDLTDDEFSNYYLGTPIDVPVQPIQAELLLVQPAVEERVDWRSKGAVTPIKDQGQCGSCWSFSTTGATEGCHFLATGELVGLSEQNLVDCSTSNSGCNGGLMTLAMDYIIKNGGIDSEESYPYHAQDGSCKYKVEDKAATLKGYDNVLQGSENDLKSKVSKGPTSIAIDASPTSLRFYSKGVYFEPQCSSSRLNHGVLAVGYDSEAGQDYWIVKNSWGTQWGNKGYIYMARNRSNNCGVATMATHPKC